MDQTSVEHNQDTPGSARLAIVIPATMFGFFYAAMLEYALPLYFSAVSEGGQQAYPANAWSVLIKYQILPFVFTPVFAGLLAHRYGERAVWCGALLGKAIIPPILAFEPSFTTFKWLAVWQGLTGALLWISGVSLSQMVPAKKKGLANAMMMMALGFGSIFGSLIGRFLLYQEELVRLLSEQNLREFFYRLFNFSSMVDKPQIADFQNMFVVLTLTTLVSSLAVGLWSQHPGRFGSDKKLVQWGDVIRDFGRLIRVHRFWALVVTLCVLGGPLFQASNQFLPYRAEELGLKNGSQDSGWIWLNLLKTLMWIPGGAAVGLLAGRRAPGLAAVLMLVAFSLATLGIGISQLPWHLYASVAAFEFIRQLMRWSFSGYVSEHMPSDLRSTAIGLSVTFAGLSSAIYCWVADALWTPDASQMNPSRMPFYSVVVLGLSGAILLAVYDFRWPIRDENPTATNL